MQRLMQFTVSANPVFCHCKFRIAPFFVSHSQNNIYDNKYDDIAQGYVVSELYLFIECVT